jgi:hypothetical protein
VRDKLRAVRPQLRAVRPQLKAVRQQLKAVRPQLKAVRQQLKERSMAEGFTLIEAGAAVELRADVSDGRVRVTPTTLRETLGWELKPQGLCRGSVCVPITRPAALADDVGIDLRALADALGRPLALDVDERVGALGTAVADRAAQLDSLEAPDFELPDLSGKLHRLSDHRGKKVLLVVYASW